MRRFGCELKRLQEMLFLLCFFYSRSKRKHIQIDEMTFLLIGKEKVIEATNDFINDVGK